MQASPETDRDQSNHSVAHAGTSAIDVVDYLLTAHGVARGHEVDLLLDLRGALARQEDAEEVLDLFCRVRVMMEQRHYVGFYRLRRWLENNVMARVRVNGQSAERTARIILNRYCMEAIRSGCVLSARQTCEPLHYSRVGFYFKRDEETQMAQRAGATSAPA